MCCSEFWAGMAAGLAVGACAGYRVKANERQIRRSINRTARSMENAFDSMMR